MSLRVLPRIVVVDGRTRSGGDPVRAAKSVAPDGRLLLDFRGLRTGHTAAALRCARAVAQARPAGIAVAGSFRELADLTVLLERPQDQVVLGDAALTDPSLIDFCVQGHGARVAAQVRWRMGIAGEPEVFADDGRSPTGREVVAWCRQVERRGAAEILLEDAGDPGEEEPWTALIQAAAAAVKVPIVAACGLAHDRLLAAGAAGVVVDVGSIS